MPEPPDYDKKCTEDGCTKFAPPDHDLCAGCRVTAELDHTRPSPDHPRQVKEEYHDDGSVTHRVRYPHPMGPDELIDFVGVDRERYDVKETNRWYNGREWCHQLKEKPREQVVEAEEVIEGALQKLRDASPERVRRDHEHVGRGDRLLVPEVQLTDHHLSMLAHAPETLEADYDNEISAELFIGGLKEHVDRARMLGRGIDHFVLPIGNDIVHADSWADGGPSTAAGTAVDVDTRRKKMYRLLRSTVTEGVEYITRIAPVKIVVVEGNHAPETEFTFGELMDARFYNDANVVVDNSDGPRKYHDFGNVLLGFTHGDDVPKGRLPMMMPIEESGAWDRVVSNGGVAEWHTGHKHRIDKRGFVEDVEEDVRVRIRTLPTLAPRDAWHARKGYSHVRSTECYLWSHEYGYEGHLNSTPRSISDYLLGGAA